VLSLAKFTLNDEVINKGLVYEIRSLFYNLKDIKDLEEICINIRQKYFRRKK
jgi:hypothetical protein